MTQKEFYFESMINSASDSIIFLESTGIITSCNIAAIQLFGFNRKELIGKKYISLMPEKYHKEFFEVCQSVLFNESKNFFFTDRLTKDGTIIQTNVSFSPIVDREGKTIGISVIETKVPEQLLVKNKAESLIETAPDGMVVVNSLGQIVLVNSQMEKLFGYHKEELTGQEIEILIPQRFNKAHCNHRKKYFAEPKTRSMGLGLELYGRMKDGSEFPVEISLSPLKVKNETFVSAVVRDISERIKAEKKFRDLLESAPDAIVIVNAEGLIHLVNSQAEKLFEYKREELLNQPVEILIPERFRNRHVEHRNHYFLSPKIRGMGVGLELFGRKKSGKEFNIEISLSPLETEEGVLVSAAVRDISDRKRFEAHLKEQAISLDYLNKELKNFVYFASHDFKEPLRTVNTMIELIKLKMQNQLSAETKEHMKLITNAVDRMNLLISALLHYSQVGNEAVSDEVDCNSLIEQILCDLKREIEGIQIDFQISKLPKIKGFPRSLHRLFHHLISNAIKYRKKNKQLKIEINCKTGKDDFLFYIRDNGIGIDKKNIEEIFLVFKTLLDKREYKGTGLGLAECKKIVEMHKGSIWAESLIGEGSAFYVSLPKEFEISLSPSQELAH